MMELNEYQTQAREFRLPTADNTYAHLNLAGEVGELLSLIAKARRDGALVGYHNNVQKELGDILWMVAAIADDHGLTLENIAGQNLFKLGNRQVRGTITGSGDDR